MSEVTSYKVTGDWRHVIDDGMVDLDSYPDEALPGGFVTFTPLSPVVAYAGEPSVAYTFGPIKAEIVDGVLVDSQGREGVNLPGLVGGDNITWFVSTELFFNSIQIFYPDIEIELVSDVQITALGGA